MKQSGFNEKLKNLWACHGCSNAIVCYAFTSWLMPKVNLLTVTPIFECRPANVMSKFKLI